MIIGRINKNLSLETSELSYEKVKEKFELTHFKVVKKDFFILILNKSIFFILS